MFSSSPFETTHHGADDVFEGEILVYVQLGREAYLNVTYILGEIVLCEFVGDAFDVFGAVHNRTCVGETFQILAEIGIAIFEYQLAEPFFRIGGQFDAAIAGKFYEGLQAQGPIEVDVEVCLGDAGDKFPDVLH